MHFIINKTYAMINLNNIHQLMTIQIYLHELESGETNRQTYQRNQIHKH